MKTKINKPALILLLLFLSGCGREESAAENEVVNEIESSEDDTAESTSNDEAAIVIDDESADSVPAETEEEDSLYPLLAAPSTVEKIKFALVAEGSYCIFDGEKYGYIAESGEEITPCIYDIAYPFSEGLACVCQDGKYGYIDLQGETAIPFDFDRATPFMEGLAYFSIGDDYGFMDKTGTQVFSFECDSVSSFQEGLAYFSIDGRYGYIDQNGQIVIEPIFDDAGYFQDGLAKIMKNGRFGVINRQGDVIIDIEYDSVTIGDSFIEAYSDEKYACFDRTGKAFPEQYDRIIWTRGGNYVYVEKDEKYALADKEGNVLFEPLYDMISLLPEENLLLIRENELYGIADLQGEIRIPAVYRDISYDSYERKEDSAEGGMLVLTDADGNIESVDINNLSEKIQCCYDSIDWISHDRAVVGHHGELSGIIDREGKLIELVEYDMIRVFEDGALWMKKGLQSWFYNSKGEKAENFNVYSDISKYGDCYQTKLNGKYGFLNERGEEVIPPIYSRVEGSTVYGAYNTYLLWDNGICTSIIKTGEPGQSYISKLLLQNEITPRIGLYQEFTKSGSISIGENEYDSVSARTVTQEDLRVHKKKYKLYDLNHLGEPLLYFEADPYAPTERECYFYSGFYAVLNNQLVEVVTVYEYDGSGQGDSACIWYDKETAQTFPGFRGFWGDFAHHSGYGVVYDKKNGEIKSIASLEYMAQSSMHYSNEELEKLMQAGLIYSADDKPYTKEMYEQAESGEITLIYFVNDGQTTVEKYQEMEDRYRILSFAE